MEAPVTLKKLIELHPEWADLPLTVYSPDGRVDYVGGAGRVFEGESEPNGIEGEPTEKVLIFSAN